MANETPVGDARTRFLASLVAKARESDNTRLLTAATLTHYSDPPRRFLSGIQDGFNRKGLISDRGEKKLAFSVLREFYGSPAGRTAH